MADTLYQSLLAQATPLLLGGRLKEALPLLQEAAASLSHAEADPQEQTQSFLALARLHALLGDIDNAAKWLKDAEAPARKASLWPELLRARAELEEQKSGSEGATASLAWQDALSAANADQQPFILSRLAELAKAAGEPLKAAAYYTELLSLGEKTGMTRAELLIERAICHNAAQKTELAEQDLGQAEALLGSEEDAARSRLLGQRALMALQANQTADALALAHKARDAAVNASDVLAYLPCVSLIASIYLRLGQPVEAYEALVRARVSLKDLLGPTGEAFIKPLIDTFAQTVGPRFDEIRDRYIATRRAAQKTEPSSAAPKR